MKLRFSHQWNHTFTLRKDYFGRKYVIQVTHNFCLNLSLAGHVLFVQLGRINHCCWFYLKYYCVNTLFNAM